MRVHLTDRKTSLKAKNGALSDCYDLPLRTFNKSYDRRLPANIGREGTSLRVHVDGTRRCRSIYCRDSRFNVIVIKVVIDINKQTDFPASAANCSSRERRKDGKTLQAAPLLVMPLHRFLAALDGSSGRGRAHSWTRRPMPPLPRSFWVLQFHTNPHDCTILGQAFPQVHCVR